MSLFFWCGTLRCRAAACGRGMGGDKLAKEYGARRDIVRGRGRRAQKNTPEG